MSWTRGVPSGYGAWLFDLDGVLTDTASVHARAWQATFDELLDGVDRQRGYAAAGTARHRRFDPVDDYEKYVDGKPRYDGVRDFLASRQVVLPPGRPDDPPERDTVCGVGNRKHELVRRQLADQPPAASPGAARLVTAVREDGARTAVVSASEDAVAVLAGAGLSTVFDLVVDALVAREHHLAGKPDPATYLYASAALDVPARRAVVVEDAPAGVAAGRAGGFGLVVGVARRAGPAQLLTAGADRVVRELSELLS